MMDGFVDLARHCAPAVQVETLAALVSVESGFNPLAIRVNTSRPLQQQPATKAEAVQVATALMAEGHDIDLGLGGVNGTDLRKGGLTIGEAFEPCTNLKATATLLQSHYRAAVARGASDPEARRQMVVAYYGRGDMEPGTLVRFEERVRREAKRLAPELSTIRVKADRTDLPALEVTGAPTAPSTAAEAGPKEARVAAPAAPEPERPRTPPAPRWDVFAATRGSSVLIFSTGGRQ